MAEKTIHACIDRQLPDELMLEFMRRSIEENPNNAPSFNNRLLLPGVMPDVPKMFLAAITGKLWKPGRTLRVRFLDGDARIQERVIPFAHIWSKFANVKFEFGDDRDAEIRISFKQSGSWSYLGTDALVIPRTQPTMNFGWLRTNTANDEYSRVVTHEFGHALGCIHEHQNPSTDIPWDRERVYQYYMGPPNFWTRDQVDTNLFTRYSADITQFSDFDKDSIMLYPIPNEFTVGDFEVGWNKVLSDMDKRFIGTLYPSEQKPVNQLDIGGPAREAAIGEFGELDVYTFIVLTDGSYRVETDGNSDLVMSLFGPNDETHFIAEDDDSGRRLNARIVSRLLPGTYTIRVRHYSKLRTGDYSISVATEP